MRIQIITDSCCTFPIGMADNYPIKFVPAHILVREKGTEKETDHLDGELELAEIIRRQKAGEILKTAAFSVGEAKRVFEEAIAEGATEILALSLTSFDSGVYNSFRLAVEELKLEHPEVRIELVDSFSTSAGQALLAIRVLEEIEAGQPFERVVDVARYHRWNIFLMVALDTLKFVAASGRAKAFAIRVGTMIHLSGTAILPPNSKVVENGVHRTMGRAIEAMLETVADQWTRDGKLAVIYTDDLPRAQQVRSLLAGRLSIAEDEILLTPASVLLVAHAGPGAVAVALDCGRPVRLRLGEM